ncbi:hypothetical protein [Alkalihalobacillus sp. 1P02AB]
MKTTTTKTSMIICADCGHPVKTPTDTYMTKCDHCLRKETE